MKTEKFKQEIDQFVRGLPKNVSLLPVIKTQDITDLYQFQEMDAGVESFLQGAAATLA